MLCAQWEYLHWDGYFFELLLAGTERYWMLTRNSGAISS